MHSLADDSNIAWLLCLSNTSLRAIMRVILSHSARMHILENFLAD